MSVEYLLDDIVRAIYRLSSDRDWIAKVQQATLNTEDYGIEPTHGLFGSEEWWSHIRSGELATHTLRGTITRVYMGSMNDWPEFELMTEMGEKSKWTRYADSAEAARFYQVGKRAELDYVSQRFRSKAQWAKDENKVVLEVRIEDVV